MHVLSLLLVLFVLARSQNNEDPSIETSIVPSSGSVLPYSDPFATTLNFKSLSIRNPFTWIAKFVLAFSALKTYLQTKGSKKPSDSIFTPTYYDVSLKIPLNRLLDLDECAENRFEQMIFKMAKKIKLPSLSLKGQMVISSRAIALIFPRVQLNFIPGMFSIKAVIKDSMTERTALEYDISENPRQPSWRLPGHDSYVKMCLFVVHRKIRVNYQTILGETEDIAMKIVTMKVKEYISRLQIYQRDLIESWTEHYNVNIMEWTEFFKIPPPKEIQLVQSVLASGTEALKALRTQVGRVSEASIKSWMNFFRVTTSDKDHPLQGMIRSG